MIEVHYWQGTLHCIKLVETYEEAMEVIDTEHKNASSPHYFDHDTQEELFDVNEGFATLKELTT